MREIPNQRVYLAGPHHDMTVTLILFETRGQRTDQKLRGVPWQCTFLLVVADKFNRISSFVDERRTKACEQVIWFGIPCLMREVPSQNMCSLG